MGAEHFSLILSVAITAAVAIYVRHIVRTAGKDREVDPERVQRIMRDLDYSHLDRVMTGEGRDSGMLKVVVYVGESEIARAIAENDSDLADVSDYDIRMNERAAEQLGVEERGLGGRIEGHPRNQTVWALVRKIADLWLTGTGAGEESVQAELLPMTRKSIRELDERVEKESNQSEDWNAVIKLISDDEPFSLGFYADKFESWTADEIEALRCDVVETASEEELLAEIEHRRKAGLLPDI